MKMDREKLEKKGRKYFFNYFIKFRLDFFFFYNLLRQFKFSKNILPKQNKTKEKKNQKHISQFFKNERNRIPQKKKFLPMLGS